MERWRGGWVGGWETTTVGLCVCESEEEKKIEEEDIEEEGGNLHPIEAEEEAIESNMHMHEKELSLFNSSVRVFFFFLLLVTSSSSLLLRYSFSSHYALSVLRNLID